MSANPHKLENGELLPMFGGPHDGLYMRVSVIFPFLDGGAPSSLLRIDKHWYSLNAPLRRWEYVGVDGVDVIPGFKPRQAGRGKR